MQILNDESLEKLNTLGLASRGKCLVTVRDEDELQQALAWARDNKTTVTVLGEGSNVVLVEDLDSLVLVQASLGIEVLKDTDEEVVLRVCAGENWHDLVQWSLAQGYYGLENLALIPGTVGAAPIQNIGAYGVELESFVEAVHAIRIEDSEKITLTRQECEFAYRDSVFKHRLRDKLVITEVELRLSHCTNLQLDYPALASVLRDKPRESLTPLDVFDEVVNLRQTKLPDPIVVPNVGSFFKNPVLEPGKAAALCGRYPELPAYPQRDGSVKFPAAWFIDFCGWKGHREEGVGVHPEHALVLVNYGGGCGNNLLHLADKIARSVIDTFGIQFEIEPRIYGTPRE